MSSSRQKVLAFATAGVWALAIAASFYRFKLSAKALVTVELAAKPAAVRIQIDGVKAAAGAYVETPFKLTLAPGRHRLKISREGYIGQLVTVEGQAGDVYHMEDVVLQQNPDGSYATVQISTLGKKAPPTHVELDDGFAGGDTPLTVSDLTADTSHYLVVYPRWPDRDVKARCRFSPPPAEGEDPSLVLKFRLRGGKVTKFVGCEHVRPGRRD